MANSTEPSNSASDQPKSDLRKFAEWFAPFGVEFIVIGGQAETLMGSPRVTFDVDLCYRRSPENHERLASALKGLNVRLRNAPPDLPFVPDARTLGMGSNFTFQTSIVDLDMLGWVEPIGNYDELLKNCQTYPIGPLSVKVISLDDLIRIKQHIKRSKDIDSLYQLLAIKRIREETGQK
jgi:predicted nucleotidyltransferase